MLRLNQRLAAPNLTVGVVIFAISGLILGCGGASQGSQDVSDGAVDARLDSGAPPGDGSLVEDVGVDPDSASGDTAAEDVGPDVAVVDDAQVYSGHPGEGLVIRVVDPGSAGSAVTANGTLRLTGLLFGDAETVQWQLGLQTGEIQAAPYWRSGAISLTAGDNRITVTAFDGDKIASDEIVVTYNANYRFSGHPTVSPTFAWVGQSRVALVEIELEALAIADPSSETTAIEVDRFGGFVQEVGALVDNGEVGVSGDEIAGDRVHTARVTVVCQAEGPKFFRVRVPLVGGGAALSEIIRFDCHRRVPAVACSTARDLLHDAYERLKAGDEPATVLATIRGSAAVAEAGPADDGSDVLWVRFTDGFAGIVPAAAEDLRSVGGLASAARVLSDNLLGSVPIGSLQTLVGSTLPVPSSEAVLGDEARWFGDEANATQCPPLRSASGSRELSLTGLRLAGEAGVVVLATHGAALFGTMSQSGKDAFGWRHRGAQEVLLTSTPSRCEDLLAGDVPCVVTPREPRGDCAAGLRCQVVESIATTEGAAGRGYCLDETQAELRSGQIAISPAGYAVMPAFFERWAAGRGLDGAYFYLGACSSAWNGSFAATLTAAGAAAVTGYSGRVSDAFAKTIGRQILGRLLASEKFGGDAADYGRDDEVVGAYPRFVGAEQLALGGEELINADFGAGTLSGWTVAGDGRVLARFGEATPVSGKFMGLLSTGIGYQVGPGSLEQTVCFPAESTGLSFYWRVYSEELREWCGEVTSQDTVVVSATDTTGATTELARIQVDDLCGYNDGTCSACPSPASCDSECFGQAGCQYDAEVRACVGTYQCGCGRYFAGLETSDVQFDQGGVWRTSWRQNRVDLTALAGRGPVTLRFAISDSGDSLFDSAVILDAISFD